MIGELTMDDVVKYSLFVDGWKVEVLEYPLDMPIHMVLEDVTKKHGTLAVLFVDK